MSRREGRESDSRRHRSRFDREPSPKRYRRDGKMVTERLEISDFMDPNEKHHHRLQDASPLEATLPDTKIESGAVRRESDKKVNENHERTKHSSDPSEVPRSRSFFQHDERGNAGHGSRRSNSDRGWWRDAKDQPDEGAARKAATYDTRHRSEKLEAKDNDHWHHDGFFEMEANPPPARKRPAFREKKITVDSQKNENEATEPVKSSRSDRPLLGSEKREERGRSSHYLEKSEKPYARDRDMEKPEKPYARDRDVEKPEKPYARDRDSEKSEKPHARDRDLEKLEKPYARDRDLDKPQKPYTRDRAPINGEARRGPYSSRERFGGSGSYRGRERFNKWQGRQLNDAPVEKWKHDLFQEANRSPTPKNEEEQIAKLEALLAS